MGRDGNVAMTALDMLRKARAKIAMPCAWTQRASARAVDGSSVWPGDRRAVCWCALGALRQVEIEAGFERRPDAPDDEDPWVVLSRHSPHPLEGVAAYNDAPATTHDDIMDLYDRAIAAEESRDA